MDDPINTFHEGLRRLAIWRLRSLHGGKRLKHFTLDIDGLPIEVFGYQGGSAYNEHARRASTGR